ncbi:hypothetical protein D3C85_1875840 [compost metagenome]
MTDSQKGSLLAVFVLVNYRFSYIIKSSYVLMIGMAALVPSFAYFIACEVLKSTTESVG